MNNVFMPTIGTIGAGKIAMAFCRHAMRAGFEVILSNSGEAGSLQQVADSLGCLAKAGTVEEAAAADIVLMALPFCKVPEVVAGLPDWKGRVVIDATNATTGPGFRPIDLGGSLSSCINAGYLPGACLVKAFNTLPADILAEDPATEAGNRVIFLSGNNRIAKMKVMSLAKNMGFEPVDLGSLEFGGRLQEFGGPLPALNLISQP